MSRRSSLLLLLELVLVPPLLALPGRASSPGGTAHFHEEVPLGRGDFTAVWSGSEMVIWGGWVAIDGGAAEFPVNTGTRYDPATDTWSTMATQGAPAPRARHSAVWTGSEMIVWGGVLRNGSGNDGGRYDPAADLWLPVAVDPSTPSARDQHTAVWTGRHMVVWGGDESTGPTGTGAIYDPCIDAWTGIPPSPSTPEARYAHAALWTGSAMIVWGGRGVSGLLDSGGRLDPAAGSWSATSASGAPSPRERHSAVWTGSEMIVFAGPSSSGAPATGGRYDPSSDTWRPTSVGQDAPAVGWGHSAVWTGSEMIVWGGTAVFPADTNAGGRYDPVLDRWSATSAGASVPAPRSSHRAVWSGTEMIVWGGQDDAAGGLTFLESGGRYDPAGDSWAPTSMTGSGAPGVRFDSSAVWSGTELIVWGGQDGSAYNVSLDTGARYDHATHAWSPTSVGTGVPAGRWMHSAIWTGTEMWIFGGVQGRPWHDQLFDDGGRYDPATDSWTPIPPDPSVQGARYEHTAVWTGSEMIVWGGQTLGGDSRIGSIYDPALGWRSATGAGAPPGFRGHCAVWSGGAMIVWGGLNAVDQPVDRGGRYEPSTDSWIPTSTTGAPAPRDLHATVWSGTEMIVWGGVGSGYQGLDTGGRYDPVADVWRPMSSVGAPEGRVFHSMVLAGATSCSGEGRRGSAHRRSPAASTPAGATTSPPTRGYRCRV